MSMRLLLPILAALLAGCVNLHVHFPDASGKAAEPAREAGGAEK